MIIFYDENKSVGGKVDHKFFIIVENVNLISRSKEWGSFARNSFARKILECLVLYLPYM
jgi:hypothetical protein